MTYRTKRPRLRSLLTFGVGATLAITQLGAGCVPADRGRRCMTPDGVVDDDGGNCAPDSGSPAMPGPDGGSDAK
jgi:hypothetical protein